MKENTRIFNKFQYHLEDCDCKYCTNFLGGKRGCQLNKCPYEDIKKTAIAQGRLKRKPRIRIKEYTV